MSTQLYFDISTIENIKKSTFILYTLYDEFISEFGSNSTYMLNEFVKILTIYNSDISFILSNSVKYFQKHSDILNIRLSLEKYANYNEISHEELINQIRGIINCDDKIISKKPINGDPDNYINEIVKSIEQYISKIINDIQFDEDIFMFPIGYTAYYNGHSIVLLCCKKSDNNYTCVISNTGLGVNHHPSSSKYTYSGLWEVDLDLSEIKRIIYSCIINNYEYYKESGITIINKIYKCIINIINSKPRTINRGIDIELQISGTCSYHSIYWIVQYLINDRNILQENLHFKKYLISNCLDGIINSDYSPSKYGDYLIYDVLVYKYANDYDDKLQIIKKKLDQRYIYLEQKCIINNEQLIGDNYVYNIIRYDLVNNYYTNYDIIDIIEDFEQINSLLEKSKNVCEFVHIGLIGTLKNLYKKCMNIELNINIFFKLEQVIFDIICACIGYKFSKEINFLLSNLLCRIYHKSFVEDNNDYKTKNTNRSILTSYILYDIIDDINTIINKFEDNYPYTENNKITKFMNNTIFDKFKEKIEFKDKDATIVVFVDNEPRQVSLNYEDLSNILKLDIYRNPYSLFLKIMLCGEIELDRKFLEHKNMATYLIQKRLIAINNKKIVINNYTKHENYYDLIHIVGNQLNCLYSLINNITDYDNYVGLSNLNMEYMLIVTNILNDDIIFSTNSGQNINTNKQMKIGESVELFKKINLDTLIQSNFFNEYYIDNDELYEKFVLLLLFYNDNMINHINEIRQTKIIKFIYSLHRNTKFTDNILIEFEKLFNNITEINITKIMTIMNIIKYCNSFYNYINYINCFINDINNQQSSLLHKTSLLHKIKNTFIENDNICLIYNNDKYFMKQYEMSNNNIQDKLSKFIDPNNIVLFSNNSNLLIRLVNYNIIFSIHNNTIKFLDYEIYTSGDNLMLNYWICDIPNAFIMYKKDISGVVNYYILYITYENKISFPKDKFINIWSQFNYNISNYEHIYFTENYKYCSYDIFQLHYSNLFIEKAKEEYIELYFKDCLLHNRTEIFRKSFNYDIEEISKIIRHSSDIYSNFPYSIYQKDNNILHLKDKIKSVTPNIFNNEVKFDKKLSIPNFKGSLKIINKINNILKHIRFTKFRYNPGYINLDYNPEYINLDSDCKHEYDEYLNSYLKCEYDKEYLHKLVSELVKYTLSNNITKKYNRLYKKFIKNDYNSINDFFIKNCSILYDIININNALVTLDILNKYVVNKSQIKCNNFIKLLDTLNKNKLYLDINKNQYIILFELLYGNIIRQNQYELLQNIQNDSLNIYQSTMGIGKTSVIIPLLVMENYYKNNNIVIVMPQNLCIISYNNFKSTYSILLNNYDIINDINLITTDKHFVLFINDNELKNYILTDNKKNNILQKSFVVFDEFDDMIYPNKSEYNIPVFTDITKTYIDENIVDNMIFNIVDDQKHVISETSNDIYKYLYNKFLSIKNEIGEKYIYNRTFGICRDTNYKLSDKDRYIAIPYRTSNYPIIGSEFSDYYLTKYLTYYCYINMKLDDLDYNKIFKSIYSDLTNYGKEITLQLNKIIKEDDLLLPKILLESLKNYYKTNKNVFIQYYLNKIIFPSYLKITYSQKNCSFMDVINNNIFKNKTGFSGTVNFKLPKFIDNNFEFKNIIKDNTRGGIMASITNILNNVNRIVYTQEINLDYIIAYINSSENIINAIIDCGSYFKNMKTYEISRNLMNKLSNKYNKIIFIDGSTKKYINKNFEIDNYDDKNIIDVDNLIYYSEKDSIGIDIKQPPIMHGLITIDKSLTLEKTGQGIFRLRNINFGHEIHIIHNINNNLTSYQLIDLLNKNSKNELVNNDHKYYLQNYKMLNRMISKKYDEYRYNDIEYFGNFDKYFNNYLGKLNVIDKNNKLLSDIIKNLHEKPIVNIDSQVQLNVQQNINKSAKKDTTFKPEPNKIYKIDDYYNLSNKYKLANSNIVISPHFSLYIFHNLAKKSLWNGLDNIFIIRSINLYVLKHDDKYVILTCPEMEILKNINNTLTIFSKNDESLPLEIKIICGAKLTLDEINKIFDDKYNYKYIYDLFCDIYDCVLYKSINLNKHV